MLAQGRHESLVDALTGLRNRRSLMADLDRELPAATAARPQAFLLFDLDGFKGYNDTYGHLAGDAMLTRLGDRLMRSVGELAVDVGRQLKMGAETLDELARAAELHDVGKMAIPDEILNKKGPLTDHEWGFMRRHTIIGERILLAAPALQPVARLVRSSHERWEGGGYPDDLAGDEIPLGSRVVAVCDAFDAMTTNRSYRKAMSEQEALAELTACAGTQFDPVVVESFCHVLTARNLNEAVAESAPPPRLGA